MRSHLGQAGQQEGQYQREKFPIHHFYGAETKREATQGSASVRASPTPAGRAGFREGAEGHPFECLAELACKLARLFIYRASFN